MLRYFLELMKTEVAAALVLALIVLLAFVAINHGQVHGIFTPHRMDSIILSLCVSAFTAFFYKGISVRTENSRRTYKARKVFEILRCSYNGDARGDFTVQPKRTF